MEWRRLEHAAGEWREGVFDPWEIKKGLYQKDPLPEKISIEVYQSKIKEIKKGCLLIQPLLFFAIFSDWFRLLADYLLAVVSVFVVSAGAVVVVSAGAVVVSVVVSAFLPPQATNANAKPHTTINAIRFFIVYRFF